MSDIVFDGRFRDFIRQNEKDSAHNTSKSDNDKSHPLFPFGNTQKRLCNVKKHI